VIEIATLLAEHRHADLSRALALIAGNWRDANFTRWIDPQRVLTEAWNKGRLANAKARLAAGERAPAIKVVGYRWNSDWTIYDPSDGIHRTVAAREAGKHVKAQITGYYRIRPQQCLLRGDDLWRRCEPNCSLEYIDHVDAINDAERAALMALGVRQ
jgi:hypothetical protein